MPPRDPDAVVGAIQSALAALADDGRREWWTRYLKGTAAFRGVTMGEVRGEVRRAWTAEVAAWPAAEAKALALRLLRESLTEDKLAGVLLLAEHLADEIGPADLDRLAGPLADGSIADWGATDWYAVKVLGPQAARHGAAFAEPLAAWSRVPGAPLWQRRAPAAAFAFLAAKPEPFAGFAPLALGVAEALAVDPARFAQTAVGWLLRELSKQEPEAVAAFVRAHEAQLSREARRMATAKLEGRGRR